MLETDIHSWHSTQFTQWIMIGMFFDNVDKNIKVF